MDTSRDQEKNNGTRRIVIIVPQGGVVLEVAGLMEVFERANRYTDSAVKPYLVQSATTSSDGSLRGSSGLTIVCDADITTINPHDDFDSIMVTGGPDPKLLMSEGRIVDWIRNASPHARRVASICSGAFVLASTGLLDGRKATTHWKWAAEFAENFPRVLVDADPIFIRDGKFFSSAGVSSGIDLALAFVEADLGREVALQIARSMVLYLRRPGGQSQYSQALRRQIAEPGPISSAQTWVIEHLSEEITVERLAEEAAMSPRNFARVFSRKIGTTPAKYIEELRVEQARAMLEEGDESVERIASACGFGTAGTMRRIFDRHMRTRPMDYRTRFRTSRDPFEDSQ